MSADHPLPDATRGSQPQGTPEDVRRVYSAKVMAEVAAANGMAPGSDAVAVRGNPLARVLVLKGLPGPAEVSGGPAVSGADGEAVVKALVALGYRDDDAFFALTRPESAASLERRVARVKALVEAVDPLVVIALDEQAAQDLSAAVGAAITSSTPVDVMGRRCVAVDGLEASLGDQRRKAAVWRQLKAAAPPGPIY